MIYPLDEPLYSKYIKPLVDVINKYLVGDGVMIHIDTTKYVLPKYSIQLDLLLEDKKTRTRVMRLLVTEQLEITHISFKALPSLAERIKKEIQEIAPNTKIGYTYTCKYVKRRTAIL